MANILVLQKDRTIEYGVFGVLILMSLENVLNHYAQVGAIPSIAQNIALLSPFLLFGFINKKLSHVQIILGIYFAIYLVVGHFFSVIELTDKIGSTIIYSQVLAALFISKYKFKRMDLYIRAVTIIAVLSTVYVIKNFEVDERVLLNRGHIWGELFYYLPMAWPYVFALAYAMAHKKLRLAAFILTLCAIALNSLFFKRFFIADLMLVFGLFFVEVKAKPWLKVMVVLTMVIGIVVVIQTSQDSAIGKAYFNRFSEIGESGLKMDRTTESIEVLEHMEWGEIFVGKGFAAGQSGYKERKRGGVHIGHINVIHKLGLIGFFGMLTCLTLIVAYKRKLVETDYEKFLFYFLVLSMGRSLYVNFHGIGPELFFVCYSFFYFVQKMSWKNT